MKNFLFAARIALAAAAVFAGSAHGRSSGFDESRAMHRSFASRVEAPLFDGDVADGEFAVSRSALGGRVEFGLSSVKGAAERASWRTLGTPYGDFARFRGVVDRGESRSPLRLFDGDEGNGRRRFRDDDVADQVVVVGEPRVSPVPEPSTWASLVAGLTLLAVVAVRRRRRS